MSLSKTNPICFFLNFILSHMKGKDKFLFPSKISFEHFSGAGFFCVEKRFAESLGFSALVIFTQEYVTHVSILTSDTSIFLQRKNSPVYRTFRYQKEFPWILFPSFRWIPWAPIHFQRFYARPVSYYAFFKGWLLPSPPPGCLCLKTSFTTQD